MKQHKPMDVLTRNKSLVIVLFVLSFSWIDLQAQVHNNGLLHATNNSYIYIKSGNITFGNGSITTTSKSNTYSETDGKFILSSTSSFSTDGSTSKFIDGYAKINSSTETILAIGSGLIYAPVKVKAVSDAGVEVLYVNEPPLNNYSADIDASLAVVANTEYWIIKGVKSFISLSWRPSSGISSLSFPDLTIVGYKNGKWEAVPSSIEETSFLGGLSNINTSGSIKSTDNVILANYEAFAIGKKGVSCAELIASSGTTKTWNGSWTPSAPTLADPVMISSPYAAGSFACNSITLNANVTLSGTESLEIVYGATGTGKVIMSSEASVVQRDKNAAAPAIELTKTTRPMKRFDYVYWGAPITADAFTQLNTAQATGATLADAFDAKYKYVAGDITTAGGWQPLTATTPGNGFITRVKEQAPLITPTATATIDVKFDGTANNGDITVPVSFVNGTPTSARNNNLLANPYPSAIDADKFLTGNSGLLDGVIYLWKSQTTNDGAGQAYSNADYIAYTKAGTTAASGTGTDNTFSGKIASGQGFKVKALGDGNVLFTNCMRVVGSNSQFYRMNDFATNTSETIDRFKMNLQTASGIANQVLVAYLPQTTSAYDYMYDAELYSVSPTKMYSILDNDTKKLAINARPTFEDTDEVTVGFTKETTDNTQMSFNIVEKEGLFASNQTPIYLYDNQLNVYHDFATGPYVFNTNSQENNTRFKIVYQNALLGNDSFDSNLTISTLKDKVLKVNSKLTIEEVKVFDLTGRIILDATTDNKAVSFTADFNQADGVYIVKVKLINGQIVTSKLINKN